MKKVYVFDFDGTITTCDTFVAFIRYAVGDIACLWGFILYSPLLLMMKLRLYPNWKAKQRLFSYFFEGAKLSRFDTVCRRFAMDNRHILRPKAMEEIQKALAEGSKVGIVSASIDNWVRPFFEDIAANGKTPVVLGTRIEHVGGWLTGRFEGANCYGEEKVSRIQDEFPGRDSYELIAFGDSRGDKEMLEYADKGYYKPFK